MDDNPYQAGKASSEPVPMVGANRATLDHDVVLPLIQAAGWMKFLGIMNIIYGAVYCLTIIGAIVGWLPIWIGVSLTGASNSLRQGYRRQDPNQIRTGIGQLALVIKIFGILMMISLVLTGLYLVVVVLFLFAGVAASMAR